MQMYCTLFVKQKCLFCRFLGYFSERNHTVHNKHITPHVKVLNNTENAGYQLWNISLKNTSIPCFPIEDACKYSFLSHFYTLVQLKMQLTTQKTDIFDPKGVQWLVKKT